jgi:hypothetical protein
MKTYIRNILYILLAAALAGTVSCAHNNGMPVPHVGVSSRGANESQAKMLRISATVDGSEKIVFTTEGVRVKHLHWSPMTHVMFDGKPWTDLNRTPANWLGTSGRLDLTKARIVKRAGRDVIALETTPEGFDLYLVDSPNGAARYHVTIAIPYRK